MQFLARNPHATGLDIDEASHGLLELMLQNLMDNKGLLMVNRLNYDLIISFSSMGSLVRVQYRPPEAEENGKLPSAFIYIIFSHVKEADKQHTPQDTARAVNINRVRTK
jgi:hypothetical protein